MMAHGVSLAPRHQDTQPKPEPRWMVFPTHGCVPRTHQGFAACTLGTAWPGGTQSQGGDRVTLQQPPPPATKTCPRSSVGSLCHHPCPACGGGDLCAMPGGEGVCVWGDNDPLRPRAAPPELQEKTLVLVKPDAVQRRLVGHVIQRFERRGFKLVAMKLLQVALPTQLPPPPLRVPCSRCHAECWEGGAKGGHPLGVPTVTLRCHQADRGLLDKHYQQLQQKPFYPALLAYMTSGPLVAMVWEGYNVVRSTRAMVGDTNSATAAAGTIRGDFSMHVSRNVVHASDSVETAQREIGFWFQRDELVAWESGDRDYTYGP
uniref:Nucleoside diphosphate kinase n=1 Tax=Calidris pygmaea TaxID=425635 RepID=A0A8C3JUL6_9CHAR